MIEVCTIGGYDEIGKNMTAVNIDGRVIILDMGIHLPTYIKYTEDEDIRKISIKRLIEVGAIPDDSVINDWWSKVALIVPTHAHLDHLGALPFISNKYKAEILCTPYTAELIKTIVHDENIKLKNKVKVLLPNSSYKIGDVTVEFINTTHSTPQAVMVALHTKYGVILYCNDFKFDSFPVLGKKPNFKRLKELRNVKLLICDSTRVGDAKKTPSESVAREMLKDVLLGIESEGKAILVTTFSSHIARLKSIIEYGRKINRKIILMGRSLAKYVAAAENVGIVHFSKMNHVEICKFSDQIKKRLRRIEKEKEKYLLIVTGHQGEPKAVLSKIADGEFKFKLDKEDNVIFSCTVIPTEINISNRRALEEKLRVSKARIFRDIHVSGHAAREDIRDLINIVNPEQIIPAHCEKQMATDMAELAKETGHNIVHIMHDGQRLKIK